MDKHYIDNKSVDELNSMGSSFYFDGCVYKDTEQTKGNQHMNEDTKSMRRGRPKMRWYLSKEQEGNTFLLGSADTKEELINDMDAEQKMDLLDGKLTIYKGYFEQVAVGLK